MLQTAGKNLCTIQIKFKRPKTSTENQADQEPSEPRKSWNDK